MYQDYVLRARDYNAKKKALKSLRSKASSRNPDEFYFAMTSSTTRDGGIKVSERADAGAMSVDVVRLLKTQDAGYVRTQAAVERRAIEKLEGELGFMDSGKSAGVGLSGKHTVFVDSEREARDFKAEVYFGTHKDLLERRFNRPRMEQLAEVDGAGKRVEGEAGEVRKKKGRDTEEKKMAKRREGKYKELEGRMKRAAELKVAERALELQRARMGKGAMITKNKWARVRKR